MTKPVNPAFDAWLAGIGAECVIAQVLVRRVGEKFNLRHADDAEAAESSLRNVTVDELRELAQMTESGAFRPLKSAPNLRRGWRLSGATEVQLNAALDQLYPGVVPDWFAAAGDRPPVTGYREFTARQTGMYRVTTMLDDAQAATAIQACCDRRFCLKRRMWTVEGLAADPPGTPSVIPCLEPCPVFLELARKAARLEQEDKVALSLGPGELETVLEALATGASGAGNQREADFGDATNPRRMQMLWIKLKALKIPSSDRGNH